MSAYKTRMTARKVGRGHRTPPRRLDLIEDDRPPTCGDGDLMAEREDPAGGEGLSFCRRVTGDGGG